MHIFRKESILEIALSQNLKQMISLITKTLVTCCVQYFTIVEMVRYLRGQTYQNVGISIKKKRFSYRITFKTKLLIEKY